MEVAVAVASATWYLFDQAAKGSPHVNPWTRKGFIDELDLMAKCVIKSECQLGLVDQLR